MITIDVKHIGYDSASKFDKELFTEYLEVSRLSLASKILCDLAIRDYVQSVTFTFTSSDFLERKIKE